MQLTIAPNRKIGDIQKDFNQMFPFLKIEFFNNRSLSASKFAAKQLIPASKTIGDTQRAIADGTLEIDENMKVHDLEKLFHDQFSLAVQVFRKSGPVWLETTMTDNWTLSQQNKHGSELSTDRPVKKDIPDYDLNRDNL
jgi:hypothetical protein